jgi:hypothetical protein
MRDDCSSANEALTRVPCSRCACPSTESVDPEQLSLAAWLLRDANDCDELAGVVAAAENSFHTLCTHLAGLLTAGACQVLLKRAINLASIEFAFLWGVRAGTLPGKCLEGVQESGQGVTLEHMKAGLIALMATLIGLLESLVGKDLTRRLISDVSPNPPPPGAAETHRATRRECP